MPGAVHIGKRVAPIDWAGVPAGYVGKCSAVCRTLQECEDLVRYFGSPDFAPFQPVLVMVPGAAAPTAITGLGYATAAELRDCAVVTWHTQLEKLDAGKPFLDFDSLREKHGMMRREDVDTATRDALLRRIARHKANPISDPPRQPEQTDLRKTQFKIDKEAPRAT